ncbi:hypothetical protein CISIN_1g038843mg [Citrus sinensis]|uniref:NB-ARC domain-containing protein n=1 Tax=Citrus sinensis TaxID=2711 RepID=A0A067DTR7_CITSI|nr:hypothetical protein CISIN_1g038843mg [Citrus sinensis]
MVESILTVVLEVVKCLAPPAERQFSYLRSYNNNHAVDEAKRKGIEIEKKVEKWLDSVNNAIFEAEKFVGDEAAANKQCFKGLCPNLKTRIEHNKEALRQLEAIVKLREAGRFDRISYRSLREDIVIMSNKDYAPFESRMSTLNDILGALKNPDVNMLGIYGMGGIRKTTLPKEVARKAENEKLFDQVIFAEVSQNQDIRKIQGEIGCKILLRARSEDTLSRKLDSKQNFSSLFKKMAGDYIEGSEFKSVAMDVAEECAGLPVSIVTIARALRNKSLFEWKDAL